VWTYKFLLHGNIGLCYLEIISLLCGDIGLCCGNIGLFCVCIGLFVGNIGLVCGNIGLVCGNNYFHISPTLYQYNNFITNSI